MNMSYETDRLLLRILHGDSADKVLQFYLNNKEIFEACEPSRTKNFYTSSYHRTLLTCEFSLTLDLSAVRFWVFEKIRPTHIIGTVSFHDIVQSVYQSCQLGYKFDHNCWHRGFAKESIAKGISIMFDELALHRIEAFAMPTNSSSLHLLEKLNFVNEGLCRQNILIQGEWTDHYRYSLIHQ
ncbi:GNAT family N-acetyltransferase [Lachnospiraceae bacterium ZAX-1]